MRRRIVRWLFRWVYRVAFAERVDHAELLEARSYTSDELVALRALWRQHVMDGPHRASWCRMREERHR